VTKPLNFSKLIKIVENAVKVSNLSEENRHLKDRLIELSPNIITQNKIMLGICKKAKQLARTDLPILITGENGTGKEIVADFIHLNSSRQARKMLKINCAAFPESLLDNELFGHEKGSYTGADSAFRGVF
jgi:DNA-binding NtrC family response regulator